MYRFFDFFLLNRRLLAFISAADHSSDHQRAFSQVPRGKPAEAQIPLSYRHYPAACRPLAARFNVTFRHTQHVKNCVNNNDAAVASPWLFDNYPMPARIE
jgi:hypothetical protein